MKQTKLIKCLNCNRAISDNIKICNVCKDKFIRNNLIKKEFNKLGCGFGYIDHKEMNLKICSKIEGLCENCQILNEGNNGANKQL